VRLLVGRPAAVCLRGWPCVATSHRRSRFCVCGETPRELGRLRGCSYFYAAFLNYGEACRGSNPIAVCAPLRAGSRGRLCQASGQHASCRGRQVVRRLLQAVCSQNLVGRQRKAGRGGGGQVAGAAAMVGCSKDGRGGQRLCLWSWAGGPAHRGIPHAGGCGWRRRGPGGSGGRSGNEGSQGEMLRAQQRAGPGWPRRRRGAASRIDCGALFGFREGTGSPMSAAVSNIRGTWEGSSGRLLIAGVLPICVCTLCLPPGVLPVPCRRAGRIWRHAPLPGVAAGHGISGLGSGRFGRAVEVLAGGKRGWGREQAPMPAAARGRGGCHRVMRPCVCKRDGCWIDVVSQAQDCRAVRGVWGWGRPEEG
jgi:hypothetical protein